MGEVVLRLEGITKNFGTLKANENVSLILEKGEVLALLGENGAGKTTLMNILFGQYTADSGRVEVFKLLLGMANFGFGCRVEWFTTLYLAHNLSVLENVILGTSSLVLKLQRQAGPSTTRTCQSISLKINPDARVSALSVGSVNG